MFFVAQRKVIPYKKRFRPNPAFLILLIIVAYIIILFVNYFTKRPVSIYEVNATSISDDEPLQGFIMREEVVFYSNEQGYINYYNADGNRVGKGDVVYTVDTTGEVSDLLDNLQKENSTLENITAMREVIAGFQNSFSMASYNRVSSFHYEMENTIFEQSRGNLYSDLNKAMKESGQSDTFVKLKAQKSGVISYGIDGYENTKIEEITPELFDKYGSVVRNQLQSSEKIEMGAPVYKMVTSNDWSLVVKLDESYYERLKTEDSVRVTVVKDDISFNAALELFRKEGVWYAKLSTARYMERYLSDRFLEIEFQLNAATGLKIPNTSILERDYYIIPANATTVSGNDRGVVKQIADENGEATYQFVSIEGSSLKDNNYYVNSSILKAGDILMNAEDNTSYVVNTKDTLNGVYCVNEGYCNFKPIDILYQNNEYTIVSDVTSGGLTAYDHILVDPTTVDDDDFIV